MGKKGILVTAVETAVKAAEKALAPSPLAKRMVAAAASQAIAVAEQRAREAVAPIDKAVQRATEPGTKERSARAPAQEQPKRKSSRRKSGPHKSAASRKKAKSSARSGAARRSKKKSGRGRRQKKSRR